MKKTLMVVAILFLGLTSYGQRFITKTGHIYFHSEAPLETIEALNKQVNSALDTQSGMFVFQVLMKSFIFEKALMQEHFNENYVESDQFPKSVFKGQIENIALIDFNKPGTYDAIVSGILTLHGVSRKVTENGKFIVTIGGIEGKSKFSIKLSDFGINIPEIVAGKIAKSLTIYVDVNLKPLNN